MSSVRPQRDRAGDMAVSGLIEAARSGGESLGQLLQLYRNYLNILASTQLNQRLHARVSPSDLVQETMLSVHRDFRQFRGATEGELLAWLRQVLINSLRHAVELHVAAKKRDIRCEVSIDEAAKALDRSAVSMRNNLVDPGPSPSAVVRERERSVALADQLARLKPEYRDVIVLRNLQGLSFDEVAIRMDRKPGAVRMLWLRAMEKLKQICDPIE